MSNLTAFCLGNWVDKSQSLAALESETRSWEKDGLNSTLVSAKETPQVYTTPEVPRAMKKRI